jgi:hypothetical protein
MNKFLFSILFLFLFSPVFAQSEEEIMAALENNEIPQAVCGNHVKSEFHAGPYCYCGQDTVRFTVSEYPYLLNKDTVDYAIARAISIMADATGKIIIQDSVGCDINIVFDYIDSLGGTLGEAYYPFGKKPRDLKVDKYDIQPRGKKGPAYDFFTILIHELQHSFGVPHTDCSCSSMDPLYRGTLDNITSFDRMVIGSKYRGISSFVTGKHHYIPIRVQSSKKKISRYFTESEFLTKCTLKHDHYIDSILVVAADYIRHKYKSPVKVVSTYRPPDCNRLANGAQSSQHLYANALDLKFLIPSAYRHYKRDIQNKNETFKKLTEMGINGFGIYGTSFHIDTRDSHIVIWSKNTMSDCSDCDVLECD